MGWRVHGDFTAVIEQRGDGYVGYCPDVPGAKGEGRTPEECRESLAGSIASLREHLEEVTSLGVSGLF